MGYVEQIFTKLNRRMPAPVPLRLRTIKIDGISGECSSIAWGQGGHVTPDFLVTRVNCLLVCC